VSLAAQSKAWVCGRSLAGIVGSNPGRRSNVLFVSVVCCVRWRSLRQADHLSRGVLRNVVCLDECGREASIMRRLWPTAVCRAVK
jgi:hypothetical protein